VRHTPDAAAYGNRPSTIGSRGAGTPRSMPRGPSRGPPQGTGLAAARARSLSANRAPEGSLRHASDVTEMVPGHFVDSGIPGVWAQAGGPKPAGLRTMEFRRHRAFLGKYNGAGSNTFHATAPFVANPNHTTGPLAAPAEGSLRHEAVAAASEIEYRAGPARPVSIGHGMRAPLDAPSQAGSARSALTAEVLAAHDAMSQGGPSRAGSVRPPGSLRPPASVRPPGSVRRSVYGDEAYSYTGSGMPGPRGHEVYEDEAYGSAGSAVHGPVHSRVYGDEVYSTLGSEMPGPGRHMVYGEEVYSQVGSEVPGSVRHEVVGGEVYSHAAPVGGGRLRHAVTAEDVYSNAGSARPPSLGTRHLGRSAYGQVPMSARR